MNAMWTSHPLFIVLATVVLTLMGKYAWNRWLSESSRISLKDCLKNQALCQKELLAKICNQGERLDDGDDMFRSTRQYQRAVILTLLQVCNKLGVDCDHITKVMVEQDILQ